MWLIFMGFFIKKKFGSTAEGADFRAGQLLQHLRRKTKHVVWRARGGPDLLKSHQMGIHKAADRGEMPQRADPADGKAGLAAHHSGIRARKRVCWAPAPRRTTPEGRVTGPVTENVPAGRLTTQCPALGTRPPAALTA